MATQALYRRWRSQTFAEILGQDHVTATLLNALRAGRIAHAYLFSGPRGTGKTTTARVLAKAVNCLDPQDGEPCNRCNICKSINDGRALDLIEIDAASNRGIDEIRDLREKIAFSPTECRYKVYVVDEVHMLTNEAFNALLKTLEEPPPHAIFVLATTAPHKIPNTVLSRCQRFDFRRVALPHLLQKLQLICEKEGVQIEPAALEAIARHAAGSFRDAESLLDQLMSYGAEEIRREDVRRVLGSAPDEMVAGIVGAVVDGDASAGLRLINEALDSGVEPRQLTHEVLEYLRAMMLLKNGGGELLNVTAEMLQQMTDQAERLRLRRLLRTVKLFNHAANQVKTGLHSQLPLELALVEATLDSNSTSSNEPQATQKPASRPEPRKAAVSEKGPPPYTAKAPPKPKPRPDNPQPAYTRREGPNPAQPEAEASQPEAASQGGEVSVDWLKANWARVLAAVRPHNRSVEALLKACEATDITGDVVTLGFYYAFHKERVSEEANRKVVEEALSALAGRALRVKCVLAAGDRKQKEEQSKAQRRIELLKQPMVEEGAKLGGRVVDVH
jgi:DNA polymerase-3 subunit gamma/tau